MTEASNNMKHKAKARLEPLVTEYCGSYTRHGHGVYAVCGKLFKDEKPHKCDACKLKEIATLYNQLIDQVDEEDKHDYLMSILGK